MIQWLIKKKDYKDDIHWLNKAMLYSTIALHQSKLESKQGYISQYHCIIHRAHCKWRFLLPPFII